MNDMKDLRHKMVDTQIAARGVRSPLVLEAMRTVPREAFLPRELREFAYDDSPLPIDAEQTISQPYIVAFMIEALCLRGGERVLEIGAGSGYAAAVLAQIASDVFTVERIGQLAEKAASVLSDLGYDNVHVLHADGTLGWEEHAPFDAIIVAAGGPEVPAHLKQQLKIGGRLVMPIGTDPRVQELVRVTRLNKDEFKTEDLADVRFVPLIGKEGWALEESFPATRAHPQPSKKSLDADLVSAIAETCEPFEDIDRVDLAPLKARIGDAKIVLLGEASHGTSEFYRMRERITKELLQTGGFNFIAIEGDWPDVSRIDNYVRHTNYPPSEWTAFARFPTWMWRNQEVRAFVDWLHDHNASMPPESRVAFYGLDLYSLYNSIQSVLAYLDDVDPDTAEIARQRYGCLTPWQADPATYGRAALSSTYRTCEKEVVRMLVDLLEKQSVYTENDGARFMDAAQNARLIANAEEYYRTMYYGSRSSWNLRDSHMFETLKSLLEFHGPESKAIVWAHNSHVGDSAATEMAARGEYNIGHLCRQEYGDDAYIIGFGTNTGTVAAASEWDGPMEQKTVKPARPDSYEYLCHSVELPNFMLPLRADAAIRDGLSKPRLERAIGVIYRPETELVSHYFQAILPEQFDEYVWFDESKAVTPLKTKEIEGLPDTYPFGL